MTRRFIDMVENIHNWWQNNNATVYAGFERLVNALERIGRGIIRMALIGLVINLLTINLYPEFPEKFPVIYTWFNGCMAFVEFAIKVALGTIHAIFTGTWNSFYESYSTEFYELWAQFTRWLSQLF